MGCGSSIRKELYNTKGVSEVEFDFEEDRKTNIAKIKFDKNKVSVEEMVSIVNTMNENQFKVGKTETENINTKNSKEEVIHTHSSDKNESHEIIKTSSSSFGVTGFIALITNFLTKKSPSFKTISLD
jgi:copper chaperone CopZ